jgi:hypothetical protein
MYISRISLFVLFHFKTVQSHIVLTHLFFESSISLRRHSSVDFSNPAPEDVDLVETLIRDHGMKVTLEPGMVLFVPPLWSHFTMSNTNETASINWFS